MKIYREFALFYARGYQNLSRTIAEPLPQVLERFGLKPKRVLDLACGEGTFAVEIAKRGYQVTGVDLSPDMLRFAREKAKEAGVDVKFIEQDMRDLQLDEKFDLVTCWGDSLNYLLKYDDLVKTFRNVRDLEKLFGGIEAPNEVDPGDGYKASMGDGTRVLCLCGISS